MLRRSFLITTAAIGTWLSTACSQPPSAAPAKFSVSAQQLSHALQQEFPKRFPVAGLLGLEMLLPQIQMLPASNQLQAHLQVQLSGTALPRSYDGHMDVRFGLHYVREDRTVRAQRVQVDALILQEAPEAIAEMLSTYGARLAALALDQYVLYRISDEDLQLAHSLNLEPGSITVTSTGLDMAIVRKPIQP